MTQKQNDKTEETKPEEIKVDAALVGKPINELTPVELATLASQLSGLTSTIADRQKAIKDVAEGESFGKIATVAKEQAAALGWVKLPKLILNPDEAGENYSVAYVSKKVKSTSGKRATSEVSNGAITINKIGIAMGGIAWFKDKDGNEHEGIKALVKVLKQPDGEPEQDRCWDISKKGISASDIVIKYHADEVTLVFNDSSEKLVKDAVKEMEEARAAAATQ